MTLGIRQLAMFASKNKQVVQIRIQVCPAEAVLGRWSLVSTMGEHYHLNMLIYTPNGQTIMQINSSNVPVTSERMWLNLHRF